MNYIFKLMQSVRSMINNVPKDFKDHVFLTVVYLFVVVQWLSLSVSSTAGIIAIAVGFVRCNYLGNS